MVDDYIFRRHCHLCTNHAMCLAQMKCELLEWLEEFDDNIAEVSELADDISEFTDKEKKYLSNK